ncbi:hypothetical protein BT96DRAFT_980865, partial [Gymnopus androsaceus JB14]
MTSEQGPPQGQELCNVLKRRVELLEDELEEAKSGKKRSQTSKRSMGRGITRIVSLFVDPKALVKAYFAFQNTEDGDVESEEFEDEDNFTPQELADREKRRQEKRTTARNLTSFGILCDLIPGFIELLHAGARGARSDDINRLKETVAHWLNFRPVGQCSVPLLKHDDRTGRGFNNNLTGRLLTPIEFDWENQSVRAAIRSKSVVTSNSYFLRAFYLNENGDPNNVEENFLQSTLLLQTWRQIFLSNGSLESIEGLHNSDESDDNATVTAPPAKKARKSTRKTVAQLLDVKEVTPRSIAYACVMIRYLAHHTAFIRPSYRIIQPSCPSYANLLELPASNSGLLGEFWFTIATNNNINKKMFNMFTDEI